MAEAKKRKRVKSSRPKVKGGNVRESANQVTQDSQQTASLYTTNSRLVNDAGRLAFAQALGSPYTLGSYSQINVNNRVSGHLGDQYIPGIIRIGLSPSYGGTLHPTSPLNMATRYIYSYVRHANSGRSNYEAADLMIYLLQMNEVLKLYSWFVRLYGISRTYNHKNRYYPREIINLMGVDFDDLMANLANLRFQINVFATKVNSLNIPKTMPLFIESINLYSNLYLDGNDEKAQTYFFDPISYYEYRPVDSTTGGMLTERSWIQQPAEPTKVSHLIDRLNALLFAILQDEDMNIMSGDILKAYGSENMLQLPQIPEDYVVYPVYDEMVLTQIENMSITIRSNADITQENQLLVSNPTFFAYSPSNSLGKILSFKWDSPEPSQIIDATRLAIITPVTETEKFGDLRIFRCNSGNGVSVSTGTHIVRTLHMVTAPSTIVPIDPEILIQEDTNVILNTNPVTSLLFTHFDYFPIRYAYKVSGDANYTFIGPVGDIQNYTVLSKEDLDKQHEVALLSLFGI